MLGAVSGHAVQVTLPSPVRRLLPGVALSVSAALLSITAGALLPRASVSPLVVAMFLGALVGSAGILRTPSLSRWVLPGLATTSRTILRAGVVLLGLQLSLHQLADLGWRGLSVIAITVTVTFVGTSALGRLLRVPALTSLYVATGFAICGAVAIAAMRGVVPGPGTSEGERDPDGVHAHEALGTALALVTVYGSIAVVAFPAVATLLDLSAEQAGLWIGASVQEVAQVVAAAGVVSGSALAAATVAKLARVVLLAPLLALVSATGARRGNAPAAPGAKGGQAARPPLVPGFVLGFLLAVAVRSSGLVPDAALDAVAELRDVLLASAMFALGTSVDVVRLVRTGRRALVLGAASATLCAGVGLAATVTLT